jgi:triacylglycerol esterase/lipase EstA (alpha/beta hydrolase family)
VGLLAVAAGAAAQPCQAQVRPQGADKVGNPSMRATVAAAAMSRFTSAFAVAAGSLNPDLVPWGVNDPNCRPKRKQHPVVLVNGTWENVYDNWVTMTPALRRAGLCLYGQNLGKANPQLNAAHMYQTADIRQSAAQLGAFVDRVLRETHAHKVDLVGHSQGGGLLPNYYIQFLGGRKKVHRLVGITPSNHGTALSGLGALAGLMARLSNIAGAGTGLLLGKSALQQAINMGQPEYNDVLRPLSKRPDTLPGIHYDTIATNTDEAITPWQHSFLRTGHGVIRNVVLQNFCRNDLTEHNGASHDDLVIKLVREALLGKRLSASCEDLGPLYLQAWHPGLK